MKIQVNSSIDKDGFGIVFIPTIIFCKDKGEKLLCFAWLFFEIEIDF